jgi:eukaryotic-like serine/threonine-protein kinase
MDAATRLNSALAGRYRIERELGAGGMATVFLAHDIKHERKVALKLLKPELAAVLGAERFVQEIKTTAALQHPHILPLFDSGTADGFLFYVMPYIQGETLRDKLNRETLFGVDEAVRIAVDVAEALHYAHSQGVIHRDIKPENILLANGRPLVADFGIALAVSAAAGGRMTETGLSLGTPHYMSPEQATAEKDISARSDLYSLASVLFEMLTGQPPHLGGSAQQIIMKIITEVAPPVTSLRKTVPMHVAAAVAKALEKIPADRFESAHAFAAALTNPSYTASGAGPTGSAIASPSWRARAAVPAMTIAAASLLFAAWSGTRAGDDTPPRVKRLEVVWPDADWGSYANLTVSQDGSQLVALKSAGGRTQLYLRRIDQFDDVALPGTEGARNPSFSPDGKKVVFMQQSRVSVVDLAGGPPTLLTDSAVGVPGVDWGPDGWIYFDALGVGPLARISATGAKRESLGSIDTATNEQQHVWPDALPNGKGVIFTINRGGPGQGAYETDGIGVLDLETRKHVELFRGVFARYSPTGHLLYVTRDGVLMAVPFDQDRLAVTGSPVALAQGLAVQVGASGAVNLVVTNDGSLWYTAGRDNEAQRRVDWIARDGTVSPLQPELTGDIEEIALSPSGKDLAYTLKGSEGAHVWVRPGGGTSARLTFQRSFQGVTWHPDGQQLLANSAPGDLFTIAADGSGQPTRIDKIGRTAAGERWASDGATLVFDAAGDIYALKPATDSAPVTLVASSSGERDGSLSPDGKWLLYSQTSALVVNAFVRPYPITTGGLRQVSREIGRTPRWSADGKEIFFRNARDSLVAVSVLPGSAFNVGPERALFSLDGVLDWDITPDGKRFLILRNVGKAAPKRLVVVENFFAELRAKFK